MKSTQKADTYQAQFIRTLKLIYVIVAKLLRYNERTGGNFCSFGK